MNDYLICPKCGTKTEANIIKKNVSHASWGGDYEFTGCDATNQCRHCGDSHAIRADFWLDDSSLKSITNIPFPKTGIIWYVLAEVRGAEKANKAGIYESCQITIRRLFSDRSKAENLMAAEYKHYSIVQLLSVSSEGFKNTEGKVLKDPYQIDMMHLSSLVW